jgi:Raf kinase inhibitor-like YbhB/YbcL family protein
MVATMTFTIESSAFKNGQDIPREYTCKGANRSPELSWSYAPDRTKTFALVMSDPDAPGGTFIHWVIWNIPVKENGLKAGMTQGTILSNGVAQGLNSFEKVGYGGPCPPPGKKHRYIFTLYALDRKIELKPQSSSDDLEESMKGYILSKTTLQGLFGT